MISGSRSVVITAIIEVAVIIAVAITIIIIVMIAVTVAIAVVCVTMCADIDVNQDWDTSAAMLLGVCIAMLEEVSAGMRVEVRIGALADTWLGMVV